MSPNDHPLPLHDLRIVDRSNGGATAYSAAFAAKLFAQYGADVIRVEPPSGDPMRQAGPFIDDEPGPDRSLLFNWLRAGQRSVALDLDTDTGLAALKQLLDGVDILIDSDPLALTQARGLDQPTLEDRFPNLITATVTPFGLSGPYAGYEATPAVLHALGGWVHPMGEVDRPPVSAGAELGLVMTGVFTAVGIMEALRLRPEVGGQAVDISAQEVIAATMIYDTVSFQYLGAQRQRSGHALFNDVHNLGLHPSRDGYVGVYAPLSWQLRNLFEMMGRPELSDDERFRTPESRIAFADDFQQEIVAFTETQDSLEFYHAAQARKLPFNFHPTAEQIFDSPHLNARGYFDRVPALAGHATDTSDATVPVPGLPFRLDPGLLPGLLGSRDLPAAPSIGEQTHAVLTDASVDPAAVAELTRLLASGAGQ
ncbi:MAG TPA: CoA transferase [Dehalococcoidia bacterium]|nr:CoA transferase [Dehalococcoidia bacterium]